MRESPIIILRILSMLFRVLALILAFIILLLLFGTSARFNLVDQVAVLSAIAPFGGNAALLVPTPFGGAIHGDLCILCIVLFILDWFCLRFSNRLAKENRKAA